MKKLLYTGLVAMCLAAPVAAHADDGLEISGNVDVIAGYQKDSNNSQAATGLGGLTQGDLGFATVGRGDHVGFFLDQVEIDLAKEFGENIRLRADIDFRDLIQTPDRGAGAVVDLEQGYVTVNLAVGNGMEFLIGKFNSPIGLESVDRNANAFTTFTQGYMYLIPTNVTGAKLYYAFNDNWSFDLAMVNSMNGTILGNSAIPSGLFRIGAQWGEEGRESYIHLGGGVGPESNAAVRNAAGSHNAHLDFFGNAWGNWAIGDTWDIAWEGTYRQSNNVVAGANQKAIAAQANFIWHASEAWDVKLRYAWFWEVNPDTGSGASLTGTTWSGFEGNSHSGTLGATYQIADGAKVKLEYRFDMGLRGGIANPNYHTGTAEFAYSF